MKTQGQEWYRNERASTRAMTSTKETDASGCFCTCMLVVFLIAVILAQLATSKAIGVS